MKRFILIAAVGAICVAGAALAQTQPAKTSDAQQTQAKTQPTKPAHNPDEVICRRQDEPGSRLGGTKVCHTRAEWDEMSRIARDEVERSQQTVRTPN